VSGAIIFGMGAWRSGRRFLLMAISAGLAFTCLAALSVVTETVSSAQGPRVLILVNRERHADRLAGYNGTHGSTDWPRRSVHSARQLSIEVQQQGVHDARQRM